MTETPREAVPSTENGGRKLKRVRSKRACDACHKQACKCSPGTHETRCKRCEEHDILCTYQRPAKRRGPPASRRRDDTEVSYDTRPDVPAQLQHSASSVHSTPVNSEHHEDETSRLESNAAETTDFYNAYEHVVTPQMIENLVDVYYHALFPLRPYFHWPSYREQIRRQRYRDDRGVFVVTMAVAAIAAQRCCDGDPVPSSPRSLRLDGVSIYKECYAAATNAIPHDIGSSQDLYQLMKAKAILASGCLQLGDLNKAITHLGDYSSIAAILGFHNEANWPSGLTQIEIQERRRLFWGTYQSDTYISSRVGSMFRQREAKVSVLYPAEVFDDQDISESNIRYRRDTISWLRGFNFCTDMYRLVEQAESLVRARSEMSHDDPGSQVSAFLSRPFDGFASDYLQLVKKLHSNLPLELKRVSAVTGDPQADRCSLIAFNILITSQSLKMLLVGGESSSVHLRCAIGNELLDELSTIPLSFFHGSSTVSLQHLAHVGLLLGSAIRNSLSIWTFLQVRNILLVLAHFLERIESSRSSNPRLARKLRSQIKKIDDYMQQASQPGQEPGLLLMDQSLLSKLSDPGISRSTEAQHTTSRQNTEAVQLSQSSQQQSVPSRSRLRATTTHESGENHGVNHTASLDRAMIEPSDRTLPIADDFFLPQGNTAIFPADVFDDWPFILDQPGPLNSFTLDPSGDDYGLNPDRGLNW